MSTTGDNTVMRDVNVRIHGLTHSWGSSGDYLCECGGDDCAMTMVSLSSTTFDDILAMRDTLLVATGHEQPGTAVVRKGRGYLIVRDDREPLVAIG